eukprot:evm.model.scf_732EXC.4 EVM.evm.TU.scf_732EXC.4   scf_732EXC:23262-25228(-)
MRLPLREMIGPPTPALREVNRPPSNPGAHNWSNSSSAGFAFVYMEDKRDADDAIRALDRKEFGYKRRRLRVEWAKADGSIKAREDVRRKNAHPSDTLFVVNFDVHQTREQDIEYHFEPYGRLLRVQIKRNYAFVQFETVEQAAEALKRTHGTEMMGRPLTVEFVANEDPYMMRRSPPRKGR